MDADQSALQCNACGGLSYFSPERSALECLSCGETYDLGQPDDYLARDEYAHRPDVAEPEESITPAKRAHQCQNCGGEVLFTGPALSAHCPYCNGPVFLVFGDAGYRTMALIPFRVDAPFAKRLAQEWVASRVACTAGLSDVVAQGDVAGLYAPFWTFNSDEVVQYWANYLKPGGKAIRIRSTKGRMKIAFDDMLMPASSHVTPLIRDGILHEFDPLLHEFDPRDLKPYRAGYLAEFAAERHHQTVAEGIAANRADKDLLIRNHIKYKIDRAGVHGIRYLTDTSGIHYRRILLPVWILHYTYGGRAYKIVVSGIDGRTFGERPFARRRMAFYSAVISACIIGLGMAIGAAAAF